MKHITLEELTEKTFGPPASTDRIEIEQELKMELLREEIKKLRKENKLTQSQLGEKIGVQRAQISKLENNSNNITMETLIKVLNAIGAQISFTIHRTQQIT